MVDFRGLLARLTKTFDRHDIPFMIIGGQAVLVHGEPRLTQDIDITLGLGPSALNHVLDVCADLGLNPLPEDPATFVPSTFVLPTSDPDSGVRVDLIFSTTPYEAEAIGRALRIDVGAAAVPFATAEDLILHKLFAGRARDLDDAAGVVRRQGDTLDWAYLDHWAREFASIPGRETMERELGLLRDSS